MPASWLKIYEAGNLFYSGGIFDAALIKYQEALELAREAGDQSWIGDTQRALAKTYLGLGKLEEALNAVLEAEQTDRVFWGCENQQVADDMYVHGQIRQTMGEVVEARAIFERTLLARLQALGEDHDDTLAVLIKLLRMDLEDADSHRTLIAYMQQANAVYARLHPYGSFAKALNLYTLLKPYVDQEKFAEANLIAETVQKAMRKVLGNAHPEITKVLADCSEILQIAKDGQLASWRLKTRSEVMNKTTSADLWLSQLEASKKTGDEGSAGGARVADADSAPKGLPDNFPTNYSYNKGGFAVQPNPFAPGNPQAPPAAPAQTPVQQNLQAIPNPFAQTNPQAPPAAPAQQTPQAPPEAPAQQTTQAPPEAPAQQTTQAPPEAPAQQTIQAPPEAPVQQNPPAIPNPFARTNPQAPPEAPTQQTPQAPPEAPVQQYPPAIPNPFARTNPQAPPEAPAQQTTQAPPEAPVQQNLPAIPNPFARTNSQAPLEAPVQQPPQAPPEVPVQQNPQAIPNPFARTNSPATLAPAPQQNPQAVSSPFAQSGPEIQRNSFGQSAPQIQPDEFAAAIPQLQPGDSAQDDSDWPSAYAREEGETVSLSVKPASPVESLLLANLNESLSRAARAPGSAQSEADEQADKSPWPVTVTPLPKPVAARFQEEHKQQPHAAVEKRDVLTGTLGRAGIDTESKQFSTIWLGVSAVFGVIAASIYIAGGLWVLTLQSFMLGFALGSFAVLLYLAFAYGDYQTKLAKNLPDAMELLVSELRQGVPVAEGMRSLAQNGPSVIRREFARTMRLVETGIPFIDALDELVYNVRTAEMRQLVDRIKISQSGVRSLAAEIADLARTGRERRSTKAGSQDEFRTHRSAVLMGAIVWLSISQMIFFPAIGGPVLSSLPGQAFLVIVYAAAALAVIVLLGPESSNSWTAPTLHTYQQFVESQSKGRLADELRSELAGFLDLVVMYVDSGTSLPQAIQQVTRAGTGSCPNLCRELEKSLSVMQSFKLAVPNAFRQIGRQYGVNELIQLGGTIEAAERTKSSVAYQLREQSKALKNHLKYKAATRGGSGLMAAVFVLYIIATLCGIIQPHH